MPNNNKTTTVSDADKASREIAEKEYAVKGNDLSGFKGVSPEYMTYASATEKPVATKGESDSKPEPKQDAPKAPAAPRQS